MEHDKIVSALASLEEWKKAIERRVEDTEKKIDRIFYSSFGLLVVLLLNFVEGFLKEIKK